MADTKDSDKELPSDDELRRKLRDLLKEADMAVATEKGLRGQLEERFGCSLKAKKPLFKEEIESFLSTCDDMLQEEPEADADPAEPAAKGKRKKTHAKQSLSDEMREFLGVDAKADVSRPEIVKQIWAYIKDNNLQDPSNKRKILPDDKLRTLFTFPLNMFSINKQISRHCKPAADVFNGEDNEKPAKKAKKASAAAKAPATGTAKKASGFTLPQKLSPEFAAVLGLDAASRGECTKRLWAYVKEHGLQDANNKSVILVKNDAKLYALLQVDSCKGFEMSKYTKGHFLGRADTPADALADGAYVSADAGCPAHTPAEGSADDAAGASADGADAPVVDAPNTPADRADEPTLASDALAEAQPV